MRRPGRDVRWKSFFKRLAGAWKADRINVEAAALTYYGVLALFPFLIFLVTVGGLLLDPERIAQLVDQLGRAAPAEVAQLIGGRLRQLHEQAGGGVLTLSIVGALWVASNGISSLMNALNRVLGVPETRPFWKVRLISIAVTIAGSLLALLAAVVMFGVPALGHFLGRPLAQVLGYARFVIAGLIMIVFLAMLYRYLPAVRTRRFEVFSFGAIVAVPLWLLASWAFGYYVSHFGKYGAVYGALGGVIVLLIWMWVTSQIILLGAEMNKVLTPQRELDERRVFAPRPTPGDLQPA